MSKKTVLAKDDLARHDVVAARWTCR